MARIRTTLISLLFLGSLLLPLGAIPPAQATEIAEPGGLSATGDFIQIQGDQFIFRGAPVLLKGTNYYPRDHAWNDMWGGWDSTEVSSELGMAKSLGVNVVRVLVPYERRFGWTFSAGQVNDTLLNELRQFVQIAGEHDIKVIITLFDWYDGNPEANSEEEGHNLTYLTTIVGTFADDDRVLAWDLHNEPDNYDTWKNGDPGKVIDWLKRMAAGVRRLDSRHLLTVGMAQYNSLWQAGPDGTTPLSLCDFAAFHSYDTATIGTAIEAIRQRASKPILLEETGWPSGPRYLDSNFTETFQQYVYEEMGKAVTQMGIGGIVQWVLVDYTRDPAAEVEEREDFFGLLRTDYSEKPAAAVFRDTFQATPLPSGTLTSLAMTRVKPRLPAVTPDLDRPVYFLETGVYLRGAFNYYWQAKGGLTLFGYPITGQVKEGDKTVQYFERARLELQQIEGDNYAVVIGLLGKELTQGRDFPATAWFPDNGDHRYFTETGHSLNYGFKRYWEANGGLEAFGYPISEEFVEVSPIDGQPYTVQYFERARFEYHPEHKGTPYEVQLGLLGRQLLQKRGWPQP